MARGEQDQRLVEAYENVLREAYTKGFKVGDKFIYQGDNKQLKGKKGTVQEVGVGQIKFRFDHHKKDQMMTIETEGMLKSKQWKKLDKKGKVVEERLDEFGMVIGTPLTRRGEAKSTSHVDEQVWSKDPFQFKRDLALRIVKVADWVGEQIHTSDRYHSGVDHSPKEKAYVDKVLKLMDDAASKLETAMLKARKVKMF